MTYSAGEAGPEDSPVLHAAILLAEQIRAARDEIEMGRRIPQSISVAMKEAGVFGMAMPRAWGGPELDPLVQIRVIEALAMADGSVGWCAMIGCDSGYITAFLDQDVAREMYADVFVATGAAATTTGTAQRVPGGYKVRGASRSSAAAITASGRGWVALFSRMARSASTTGGCRKRGNVFCDCRNARSWIPGTRPGSAVPVATISPSATSSCLKSTPSASKTPSLSNGLGRFTPSRSCSSRRDPAQRSGSPVARSTH